MRNPAEAERCPYMNERAVMLWQAWRHERVGKATEHGTHHSVHVVEDLEWVPPKHPEWIASKHSL